MTAVETVSGRSAALNAALATASPEAVIEKAIEQVPAGRLAIVSSFGVESAVLLKYVADVDPGLPVLFIDTGMLFEETLDYRDRLVDLFRLTDVRSLKPQFELVERRDPDRDLWLRDPDSCCHIRKVRPLSDALGAFDGWINGRKRFHGDARADIAHVESDGRLLKFNPLAALSRKDVEAVFEAEGLPRHPLERLGFSSVGCMPCTSRTREGEPPRAGRWRNQGRSDAMNAA
ncbi:MAG: phosphoadenylyl-sulfate reductase, partial [Pseudorhodoplanes sp.]